MQVSNLSVHSGLSLMTHFVASTTVAVVMLLYTELSHSHSRLDLETSENYFSLIFNGH